MRLINENDVQAIIETVFERGAGYFDEFWRTLTPEQQHELLNLASDQLNNPVIRSLEDIDVLEKTDVGYQFQIPLIEAYVSSQRSR